jgi:hypothetical protein
MGQCGVLYIRDDKKSSKIQQPQQLVIFDVKTSKVGIRDIPTYDSNEY